MRTTDINFEHVTTDEAVAIYEATYPVFVGLIREVRELSKKKPEAIMSKSKVTLVNLVLTDLVQILKEEPAGKYLSVLDDDTLPQMSDAVLAMVQFETALKAFNNRYYQYFSDKNAKYWVTEERIAGWRQ